MSKIKPVVWIIFLVSGASGLVYEVVWTRQLTLVFGSTVFAASTVLTAFMAGLALGSYYFGRMADRESRPLRLYAILEAGIGAFALIWPLLLSVLNAIYILAYRGLGAEFYSLSLIRFALSFLVLLLPSTLMGGTLPILSRFFVNRLEKLGLNVGALYALNTFGAVVGCIAAGFFLIQYLGVQASIFLAAGINFAVAVIAFLLDRISAQNTDSGEVETPETQPASDPAPVNTASDPVFRLVLVAFTVSGFCALSYEVLWTRILVFFLGSTTYAFSTMLAAFLFGIALGSFVFAWIADRLKSLVNLLGLVQIGIGLAAVALIPAFGGLYDISSTLQSMFGGGRFWAFVACVIVMSVPTLLMGISFPLVARIYTVNADILGRSVGNVYALNTVGAILGAFCAGFIFIPLIGIRPGILLMAALNLIVGCVLIFRNENRSRLFNRAAVGGTILTVGVAVIILFAANKPIFLKSAIFRTQRPGDTIIDYKEEVDATITTLKDDEDVYRLYVDTNQAADASRWDSPSHRVIAHLPLLLHPNPKRALVVGFGMGVTSYSITQHGVRVDAVEISKGVVDSARAHFSHVNRDVLDNPLFNHFINDGRNYILMTRQKYDMISTGIIHPLVSAGSSNIYTADFYRLCQRILTDDGIMCQWVPLHRVPEEHYKTIVRTFVNVFPHTTLWYKYTPDFVILIGTPRPLRINYKDFLARAQIPSVREGLAHDDLDGMSLLDSFMMGEKRVLEYVGDGPIHTDNRPHLEFFHAQDITNTTPVNVAGMTKHRERVTAYLNNYGRAIDEKKEIRRQIRQYFDATQKLIQGQIEYAKGDYDRAVGLLNQAAAINPDDDTIHYNLRVVADLFNEEYQGELKQLEQLVKQAQQKDPKDAEGYLQLAVIYEGQGKLEEAAEALEKAIDLQPAKLHFYVLLGPIYERQERFDEALRTYRRLEKVDPNLPGPILQAMAFIHHQKSEHDEAMKHVKRALKADPTSWRTHYLLGSIYAAKDEGQRAIQSYRRAIELAPNEPVTHTDLAELYFSQKRYDDALEANASAIRLAPGVPELEEQRRRIQDAMPK
ncbi:MAG: fused MFS/spermidine synthase [Candidatus Poribacteria bacterium]|nr:fused MFS/spermidine synthase [Candidatus Poribacteria bacterium]